MQKAKPGLAGVPEPGPILPGTVEQIEGPDDIGLDKGSRAPDRAVHTALGREIDHRIHPVVAEQASHQLPVADMPSTKTCLA